MMEQDVYWYWLNNIEGIGRAAIRRLLEEYEEPCYIYEEADDREIACLLQTLDLSAYEASKDSERLQREFENLKKKRVRFTYPERKIIRNGYIISRMLRWECIIRDFCRKPHRKQLQL